MMRPVLIVVGALATLGLAAFGVVAAQKAVGSASFVTLATHAISPTQQTSAPSAPPEAAKPAISKNPVVQIADMAPAPAARGSIELAAATPTVLAQNSSPASATANAVPASPTPPAATSAGSEPSSATKSTNQGSPARHHGWS